MKIANVLPDASWGGIDSTSLERGIGGREGAMIRLSREWARSGHEVTNYVATQKSERIHENEGYYEFVPAGMATTMLATFPYDAVVAWECPQVYSNERVLEMNPVRLIEMQCAHLDSWQIDAANECATGIIGLSEWHVGFLTHQGIEGPHYVLPNGVDLEHYPRRQRLSLPRTHNFVYSSSPDRGLVHLLQVWPMIRKRWPDATLHVGYGASRWLKAAMWAHRVMGEMAIETISRMKQPGVIDAGQLPGKDLAELQRQACAFAYPCNPISPTETGCITVIENFAACNPVVTTDADCLEEEFEPAAMIVPLPFNPAEFYGALEHVLTDRNVYTDLADRGRAFAEGRQWKDIAERWLELFQELRPSS